MNPFSKIPVTPSNLNKLFFILIFLIINCSLLSVKCYSQWVRQTTGVATPLYNIQFVNLNTGWATGSNSIILKTTDGGINWFQQTINLSYPKNLYGLSMLDANTGYIAGWFETILKTTNGGTNWNIISNIPTNSGNSNSAVSFVNVLTGWTCASLGRVLRTTNGGISWDTSNVGNTGPLEDIQFLNTHVGWVCGDGGNLRKTTDGGVNWIGFPLLTTANLDGLYFINSNTGWTVGEQDNMVFRTTNSGAKWDTVAILPGGSLQYSYTIYFSSALTGWIGGTYSRIFKTTDGGFTWKREKPNAAAFFENFSFYNDSIGWAVGGGGGNGTIIHTTTSGEPLAVTQINGEIPSRFALLQNFPNPFNPSTEINYNLPVSSYVTVKIYNILGEVVAILINNEYKSAGRYSVTFDGSNLASGIYFYSLTAGAFQNKKKMVLIK